MIEMGKTVSLIGNPGSGKSNLFLAAFNRFHKNGWTSGEGWPPEFGIWMESILTGKPLPPTLKQKDYQMKFKDVCYKGSKVKTGWGGLTLRVRDMRGDDYRRTTDAFKESIRGASAILITIDPSKSKDLGPAIGNQVSPLVNAIGYMLENERKLKYIGLVFTKRALHNHSIRKIRWFVTDQLGPVINTVRRADKKLRMLEVESRGLGNALTPWGLEPLFYDVLATICNVKGPRVDIFNDPDADWDRSGPRMKRGKKQGTRNNWQRSKRGKRQ